MEIWNTPKKRGINIPIKTGDGELTNGADIHRDVLNVRNSTPGHTSRVNEREMEVKEKTFEPLTPNSKTVREGLFISPVKSEPIIQTMPLSNTLSATKHGKFGSRLNSALFELEHSSDIRSSPTNYIPDGTKVVEDSPAVDSSSRPSVVEDSPNRSRVSEGGLSGRSRFSSKVDNEHDDGEDSMEESVINESVASALDEMEQSHQGDISVHDVKNILEKSLAVSVADHDSDDTDDDSHDGRLNESEIVDIKRKAKARRSISARKPVIESSEDDEETNEEAENSIEIAEHDGGEDMGEDNQSVDHKDGHDDEDHENMEQDQDNCDESMIIEDEVDNKVDKSIHRNINRSVNNVANTATDKNTINTEGELTETGSSHHHTLDTVDKVEESNITEVEDEGDNYDTESDDSSEESEVDEEEGKYT